MLYGSYARGDYMQDIFRELNVNDHIKKMDKKTFSLCLFDIICIDAKFG